MKISRNLAILSVAAIGSLFGASPAGATPLLGSDLAELYGSGCLDGDQCPHKHHRRQCRCLVQRWCECDHWL